MIKKRENKIKKTFTLHKETVEKIKELANEYPSESSVVDLAIKEFYKNKDADYNKHISDFSKLLDEKNEKLIGILERIHLAVNAINKDTQMNLEFWNHHYFVNEYDAIATTNLVETTAYKEVKKLIDKRVEESRIKKLDRENR